MRVLVIETQPAMARRLGRGLRAAGVVADVRFTVADGVRDAGGGRHAAVVIGDVGRDGFALCAQLRAAGVTAVVLVLTDTDPVDARARMLDCGADDFLPRPFSFAELGARLRLLGGAAGEPVLRVGELTLDLGTHVAHRHGTAVELSGKECALLETLMRRPGEVLDRTELVEHAWEYDYENRSNVVDVYIRYLREKIDRPFGARSIETVRRSGYRLRVDGGA